MGCDVNAHLEINIDDRWEHFCEIDIERDYFVFSKMARCGRGHNSPIVENKGIPVDINPLTALLIYRTSYHSFSFFNNIELISFIRWLESQNYCCGENLLIKFKNIYLLDFNENDEYDYRLVFGFDN
jgi:hypothetical protein